MRTNFLTRSQSFTNFLRAAKIASSSESILSDHTFIRARSDGERPWLAEVRQSERIHMSSISTVGGGTSLYSFLQSVTQSNQPSSTAATSASTTDPTSNTESSSSTPVHGHHHHHGKNSGGQDALFTQLQQTVTSALQSAEQDGTDPNTAIEDAISKIFQNNNSATGTLGTAGSTGTNSEAAQANTPASLTGTSSSSTTPGTSSAQAFFQTLQSFGVDPQQFHQDFLAAAQGAQNGSTDPSAAFQSFPPGSLIDTTG
jgi:hypothetical protein